MALGGFDGAVNDLTATLEILGAEIVTESVGRLDFAVDMKVEDTDFQPDPLNGFIRHSNTLTSVHNEDPEIEGYKIKGNKVATVTMGGISNRQISIYNKRSDVISKKKEYWWQKWGLVKKDRKNQVWRIEGRFGRDYLRDKAKITTFDDVRQKIQAEFMKLAHDYRMIVPDETETNRSRLATHDVWQAAQDVIGDEALFWGALAEPMPEAIMIERNTKAEFLRNMLLGVATSYAAVKGIAIKRMEHVISEFSIAMKYRITREKEKLVEGYQRALNRNLLFDSITGELRGGAHGY